MNWMEDININEVKDIDSNSKLIIKELGIGTLIKLTEMFGKSSIYFSEKIIYCMKRQYVIQHREQMTVKEMSRKIGVSEKFIYNIINDIKQV